MMRMPDFASLARINPSPLLKALFCVLVHGVVFTGGTTLADEASSGNTDAPDSVEVESALTRHPWVSVPAGGDHLRQAVADAQLGDHLLLAPGLHVGPVLIEQSLTLQGQPGALIDGGGEGSVIRVMAPDVVIFGLYLVGSGSDHDAIDSGVQLLEGADRTRVEGNLLVGNLFGVDVHGAVDAEVLGNRIIGRLDHRMNDRGNGIYLWNAPGTVVDGNDIRFGRDGIFVNNSSNNRFSGNRLRDLRFAIHYMYANDSEVSQNLSIGNHLGYALMFSQGMRVHGNSSIDDRDHGIMLNYANYSSIEGNTVKSSQTKCLFMYNANGNSVTGNLIEGCPIGIHFTAGSQDNRFAGNAIVGNQVQVKYVGTTHHDWSTEGAGNFWSDHTSFDLGNDGVADQAYRPNDVIDQVLWTQPAAQWLLGSPTVQLIRWAQRQFPALLPGGVVDTAPLISPPMSLQRPTPAEQLWPAESGSAGMSAGASS